MTKDDDQQKIAEKTCSAIGRFIYEFSQLEYTLRHFLGEEIKLEEKYFDAVLCHDFAQLCTVAENVFSQSRNKEFVAELHKLIKRCHSLNEDRKRVAHGLW